MDSAVVKAIKTAPGTWKSCWYFVSCFFFGWQREEANDIRKQRHHQRKVDPLNFKLFRKGNMRDEGDFATKLIWEASDSDFS